PPKAAQLQWGHGEFAVENTELQEENDAAYKASMGPRRIRRGEPHPIGSRTGTALKLQWGHGEFAVENLKNVRDQMKALAASMGRGRSGRGERRYRTAGNGRRV